MFLKKTHKAFLKYELNTLEFLFVLSVSTGNVIQLCDLNIQYSDLFWDASWKRDCVKSPPKETFIASCVNVFSLKDKLCLKIGKILLFF